MVKQGNTKDAVMSIPEMWEIKKLKDVAPLQRGFDLPYSQMKTGIYPVVFSNGIGAYHSEYMIPGPGVVTGRSGTIGKVHFVQKNYWPHNTSLWVTDFHGNHEKYIYYLFKRINWNAFNSGSGVPTLNRNDVHETEIMLPPLVEQISIAAALSDIDDLITNLEKLIAKKKAIKQGAMQELLTGKRRLPGFDGEWKTKRLKDVLTIYNGYAFKSSTYDNNTGIYKVITIANVQKGYLSTLSCNMILELPSDIQQHQLLNLGDLLISMTGNVGRVCFVTEERTVLNQRVGKLCTFDAHHDGFIFNALNTPWFLRAMMTSAKGGAQPNLSVKDIYEYELRCPPTIEEERAISTVLDDMQTEITMLEKKLAKLCKTRSGMMSELLTGRIRLIDKEDA